MTTIVRGVLRLGPRGFRDRFEAEIVCTLADALRDERARRGRLAMAMLGVRGVFDAIRVVRRERTLAAEPRRRRPMSDWRGDVRSAIRNCRRAPAFSFTIVSTLALAIGLAAAVFAFADGYLFRPLPFPEAERLYNVRDPNAPIALLASDTEILRQSELAPFGFVEWESAGVDGQLAVGDRTFDVLGAGVSTGFRATAALPLLQGRDFTAGDHVEDGGPLPIWLSYRFWQRAFSGDIGVLGRVSRVQQPRGPRELRVVGILGREFGSLDLNNRPPDFVAPSRRQRVFGPNALSFPIVRLPAGVSREQAEVQMATVLQAARPADGKPRAIRLRPVYESQVAGGRPTARVFLAGALLIVLLAVINLVHLMLTRGVSRAAEVATRAALGASRWRIARLLLTESLVLCALGTTAGLVVGWWLASVIESHVPGYPTAGRNLALVPMAFDGRVLAFTAGVGVIVALLGGGWPAWRAARRPLPSGGRSVAGVAAAVPRRWSRVILGSELAVATVLLVGTLFIGLGIWRYLNQPLGFDYKDRFSVWITPTSPRRPAPDDWAAALDAIRAVPGVAAAGSEGNETEPGPIEVPGRAIDAKSVSASRVAPGHAEAWRLDLRAGRWFDATAAGDPEAVVNERFAHAVWPDVDPLGQPIRIGNTLRHVVGVVAPRRYMLDRELRAEVFVRASGPVTQSGLVAWVPGGSRASDDVQAQLARAVTQAVPGVTATATPVTFERLFLRGIGEAQFQSPVVVAFGVLAFVLAGVGVFGLVSYLVAQRLREFGIRLALGARPQNIWRTVVGDSVVPAVIGLAVGIPGALLLESVVQSTVFGWKSSGPLAAAVVAIALVLVATLAAIPPARRAMRVDPIQILRTD